MALSEEEANTLRRLQARLSSACRGTRTELGLRSLDAYYDGTQRLAQLGLAVPHELRDFVTIVAWPGTFVDAIAERQVPVGFWMPGEPIADPEFRRIWEANDLDDECMNVHTDSLALRRAYACVGVNPDDPTTPLITVESPFEMIHEQSPATRKTTVAARFYDDDSFGEPRAVPRATLYTPTSTVHAIRGPRGWEEDTTPGFERDDHGLGVVPVEPFINSSRTHARYGRSEQQRIIGLTDAAARALTLAQVATEVMGIPQRTAAGLTQNDFKDPRTGEPLTQWEAYFGAVWATANPDAKFHQFTAADLRNFTEIVNHYAQNVSGVTGLPMRYFGQLSANPPSAEGIRADEARLILLCEKKNRERGAAWERLMRTVYRFKNGRDDPELRYLEMRWRDPATPTVSQQADRAVKLHQARIIPLRQVREDLGYSETQIENMEREDAAAALDPVAQRLLEDQVVTTDLGSGALPQAIGTGRTGP